MVMTLANINPLVHQLLKQKPESYFILFNVIIGEAPPPVPSQKRVEIKFHSSRINLSDFTRSGRERAKQS